MNCILTLLEMSAQLSFVVVFLLVDVHLCLLHRVSSHHITILLHPTIMVWSHASLVMLETTSSCVLLTVLVSATGFVIVESLIGPLTIVFHATSVVSTHDFLTW